MLHLDLLESACRLYQTLPGDLKPLHGGHYNAVYEFRRASGYAILRIGVEDCPKDQTLGMLDWVQFLSQNGAPVSAPLLSTNGKLLEEIIQDGTPFLVTAFEKAEGVLAEDIPAEQWSEALFRQIGRATGRLHRISKDYQPSSPSLCRPQWHESYEIREATERLAQVGDAAYEKLNRLINDLQQLTKGRGDFGLIHDDLHFANFLVGERNEVIIIDFDDCVYGWFAIDIAMALFDILVLHNATDEDENRRFGTHFLTHYLVGYLPENEISPFWLAQIPRFLKLKELCIYADLVGHPDVNLPDTWVGRFMRGRAARIANDVPYVDLNLVGLLKEVVMARASDHSSPIANN